MSYCIETRVDMPFYKAIEVSIAALAEAGFGVLSDIDVAATLKKKLGVERTPYPILGACNPKLAHQALESEHNVGVLLPCNVIVRADGSEVVVAAIDPMVQLRTTGNAELDPIGAQVRGLLASVIVEIGKR